MNSSFMDNVVWWFIFVPLMVPGFLIWFPFWLSCRLTAKRCPQCSSKWQTELQGEWGGELWKCHACGCCWET